MNVPATAAPSYRDALLRAANDPNFDLDKFERLCALQEAADQRAGELVFNQALSAAEAEMRPISADANNPQTRSRYATFARLDSVVRPIYTSHGFGISWNTEPMGEPNMCRVVGMLSNGAVSRRFQIDMPIDTKGIRGQDMMTRTHATSSAVTYGKRNLLIMMFNLAIGEDDDGNAATRRPPPRPAGSDFRRPPHNPNAPVETVDPETGEVSTADLAVEPAKVVFEEADDYRSWGEKLMWGLRKSRDINEIDQWLLLNQDTMLRLKDEKPALFKTLESAIDTVKERFTTT